jgi:hypothetical protein
MVHVIRRADLPENGVVAFEHGATRYVVADIDGEVRAFAVVGPAAASADRAAVAEGHLRCPLHGWPIGRLFGAAPEPLPEAGERRLGAVSGNVGSPLAELGGQLEEKRGLPHLAWPGDELDASRPGLGQPAAKRLPTAPIVEMRRITRHSRIIIRVYPAD